jgi:cardiolipin synthase
MSWFICYLTVGWFIRLGMIPIVLRRQMASGASLAWLMIVFLHPYIGAGLYLLLGESRLGPRRSELKLRAANRFRDPARHPERQLNGTNLDLPESLQPIIQQAMSIAELPVMPGNKFSFITQAPLMVDELVRQIEGAKESINLLYYIFANDERGDRVSESLAAAVKRGVRCRILADAVASRTFFGRGGLARGLKSAGIQVASALPVAPLRTRFARMDLRNHRKLAIIDGKTALMGSHNLIDEHYGGKRGNPWVDVTGVFSGTIVSELATVFAEDWYSETGEELPLPVPQPIDGGDVAMQAVPTGPLGAASTYRRLFLAAIQSSRKKIVMTTPYFVPDETTMLSLIMAADRGVKVTLILPRKGDQIVTALAGRAHFGDLLSAGIDVYLFKPGLLHSKTTTVDDAFSIFGSANLDVRSFNLNFELSLLLYGQTVTQSLLKIQEGYLADSEKVDPAVWMKRPRWTQYADTAVSLLSPLL